MEALGEEGSLVLEQRFAIVPEWVIDAGISDCAYRLYSVLLRYGQSSGQRMPGRATLAARLRKSSTDTVDRALKELVGIGAVRVEHRRRATGENLTNRYHLMATPPGGTQRATRAGSSGGGRTVAATPGRTDAAGVAADLRPDPVVPTQKNPPPAPLPTSRSSGAGSWEPEPPMPPVEAAGAPDEHAWSGDRQLLARCGITDLPGVAAECQQLRRRAGRPARRWTPDRILEVLRQAIDSQGWPAAAAVPALRVLAADPTTHSPARLACPGPWWHPDTAITRSPQAREDYGAELDQLEARLLEADGLRIGPSNGPAKTSWNVASPSPALLSPGAPASSWTPPKPPPAEAVQ